MGKHRYTVVAIAAVCALGCAWIAVLVGMRVLRTRSYTITCDRNFSPYYQAVMRTWLSKNLFAQPFSRVQENFYREYPSAASIKRSYKSWGHAHIKISARPLSILCNDAHGIACDEKVVSADSYSDYYKNIVPKLVVKEEKNIIQDQGVLIDFIQRLPADIKQSYAVTWHDPTRIELHHEQGNVRAIIMCTTDITPALRDALATFVEQGKKVQVDLRYKGQIVLGRVRS